MRKIVLIGLFIGCAVLSGCTSTISKTSDERMNAYRANIDNDLRQLGDDWDMAWLADRPGRMTRWYTR